MTFFLKEANTNIDTAYNEISRYSFGYQVEAYLKLASEVSGVTALDSDVQYLNYFLHGRRELLSDYGFLGTCMDAIIRATFAVIRYFAHLRFDWKAAEEDKKPIETRLYNKSKTFVNRVAHDFKEFGEDLRPRVTIVPYCRD
jgi:hypothetical protein